MIQINVPGVPDVSEHVSSTAVSNGNQGDIETEEQVETVAPGYRWDGEDGLKEAQGGLNVILISCSWP